MNRPTLSQSPGFCEGTQTVSSVSIHPVKELIGKLNLILKLIFKICDVSFSSAFN